ncbi:MAG: hypothetical protein AAGL68_09260 [Pseudomonadota bacterium]
MAADREGGTLPARARRFAARLRGDHVPGFGELVDPPAWSEVAKEQRTDLAAVMALLRFRPALNAELNGQKLASLAQFIGEDRFDQVCEISLDEIGVQDACEALPTPFELVEQGERLIEQAERRPEIAHLAQAAASILAQPTTQEVA